MNKRAVIITGPGFQDEEVVYPYYRLLEEGYKTDIATKDGEVVYGKYGVPARATMSVSDLKVDNFDMVILPGGFEAPDRVRLLPEVQEFVRNMDEQKKTRSRHLSWPLDNDLCWNYQRPKDDSLLEY